ncbi:MAG: DNA polymerase III subunit delta [bacterium]|nr:DNA polymerase III subunit delta [bacterium]
MNIYLIKSFSLRLLNDELEKITKDIPNIIKFSFNETRVREICEECAYYSLLDEKKCVVVFGFRADKDVGIMEDYLKNPNPNTTLVIIMDNFDKRTSLYKNISKNGKVIEIAELKYNDLNNSIMNYAKSIGVKLSVDALNKLLLFNNDNYDLVLGELDKISMITNNIDEKAVEEYGAKLVIQENFAMCDAITNKDYKNISSMLSEFESGKGEVIPFVGLLTSTYLLIFHAKNSTLSNDDLAKTLGVHQYRIKLARDKARKYTSDELYRIFDLLGELDYSLKSMNVSQYGLLKKFLIKIV